MVPGTGSTTSHTIPYLKSAAPTVSATPTTALSKASPTTTSTSTSASTASSATLATAYTPAFTVIPTRATLSSAIWSNPQFSNWIPLLEQSARLST